jgi:acyl-CoA thioesterase I
MNLRRTAAIAATLSTVIAGGAMAATALGGSSAPSCRPIRIMPMGDSITQGEDNAPEFVTPDKAYRGVLWSKLKADGVNFDFVGSHGNVMDTFPASMYDTYTFSYQGNYSGPVDIDMVGKKGYQAGRSAAAVGYQDHMVAQMLDVDLPRYQPDIVLLLLGTNDLFGGTAKHGKWSNVEATENVLGIVDKINALTPNAKVFVSPNGKTGVTTTAYDMPGADGQTFNQRLQAGVATRKAAGKNVAWVGNMFDKFVPGDMNPGLVHPGFSGHAKMADAWYAAIKSDLGCSSEPPSSTTAAPTTLAPTTTVPSPTTSRVPVTTVPPSTSTTHPIVPVTPSPTTTPVTTAMPWLKVEHSGGYRQFLLGYGPTHVWAPTLNPAGGAEHIVLRLQDLGGSLDWAALTLRPQSRSDRAVAVGSYIEAGTDTTQPFTVSIPVSAFGPDAFSGISELSFFNSSSRNPFTMAIHDVFFDSSPAFVWFGLDHRSNAFEGDPGRGQMAVTRMRGSTNPTTTTPPTIPVVTTVAAKPSTTLAPVTTTTSTKPSTSSASMTLSMKSAGGGTYKQYDSIPMTISVTNNSSAAMTGKVVKITVPADVVSGGAPVGSGEYVPWPGTVHDWKLGTLAPGETATVAVKMFTKVGGVPLLFQAAVADASAQLVINP